MRRWPEIAAAVLVVLAGPALAKESPFAGAWCAGNSEVMHVEGGSIGFNEHTVCEVSEPLPDGGVFETEIACANIYFNEGETVRAFERTVALRVEPVAKGLLVSLDDAEPALWTRCEN